jgi:hypothetical protein
MSNGKPDPDGKPDAERLIEDARTVEEKYGPFAEVYAESRSEAADIAGDEAAKKHWESVADTVEEDGDD